MTKTEAQGAIMRFRRRREARLRIRMNEATNLVEKYRLLQAIYRNRKKSIDKFGQSVTIKSQDTLVDGGPGSGNHGHNGVPGKVGGSAPKASSRGENPECVGFADKKLLKRHVARHIKEYPGLTESGYVEHAKKFLSQPCSETVDGYITNKGEVVRFDRTTGEYAKGVPGGRIVTCYIAKFDKKAGKSKLDAANAYFDRLKQSEGVEENGKEDTE